MNKAITFLFFHYGKIPRYLSHAIEHVRIFNPDAEIMVVTDGIKDVSALQRFGISHHNISEFPSNELEEFKKAYQHISCFNERYERFVLERWFVTETIRRQRPERIYVMIDSDVALFGDSSVLLPYLPDCPIALGGNNPHFTFVRGDISAFLRFILDFYGDANRLTDSRQRHADGQCAMQIYNLGEMTFLYEFMRQSQEMQTYPTDTPNGYLDVNIHIPEGFDFLQLRRRPRKKIFWHHEDGRTVPFFLRDGHSVRAFLVHFQGPGKRVFFAFNKIGAPASKIRTVALNALFQHRLLANLF